MSPAKRPKAYPVDLTNVRRISIKSRRSKVSLRNLSGVPAKGRSFKGFERSLPNVLASADFRALVDAIVRATKRGKPVLWMIGAHVIKVGLSPVLIELIRKRAISALALNGAGAIHDFEMAYAGTTSEDVAARLKDGTTA